MATHGVELSALLELALSVPASTLGAIKLGCPMHSFANEKVRRSRRSPTQDWQKFP